MIYQKYVALIAIKRHQIKFPASKFEYLVGSVFLNFPLECSILLKMDFFLLNFSFHRNFMKIPFFWPIPFRTKFKKLKFLFTARSTSPYLQTPILMLGNGISLIWSHCFFFLLSNRLFGAKFSNCSIFFKLTQF